MDDAVDPEQPHMMKTVTGFHDPVFLLGGHKSGTSLLRSLLDGVPPFFVVPVETHFFPFMGFWVDYAFRRTMPKALSFDQMAANLLRHVSLSHRSRARTSDSVLAGQWDLDHFVQFLETRGFESFQSQGLKGLMTAYIQAIYQSLHGEPMPENRRIVEKSVENGEYAVVLKKLWPKARFIHIVRNPYATLTAIRRYITRDSKFPALAHTLSAMRSNYYYLYKNPQSMDDYLVVQYEHLVTDPETTMATLSTFLEIDMDDRLLNPTVMGDPWQGNSTTRRKMDGISTGPMTAWRIDITPLEIALVNRLFSHVLADFDYPELPVEGSVMRPCPKEPMKVYAANRLLLKVAGRWL